MLALDLGWNYIFSTHIECMPDGWKVRATRIDSDGKPAVIRFYFAFESNVDRAVAAVRRDLSVNGKEVVEAVKTVTRLEFKRRGIKPGQVKPE